MLSSSGANCCLVNAEKGLRIIIDYLNANFDEARFNQGLK